MRIQVKSNERIFICGKTGSGKSVLVDKLLKSQFNNYVIYDYKHEIKAAGVEKIFARGMCDFSEQPNQQAIIYRPQVADDAEFNDLCRQIFYRGNNTLILDEVADHTTSTKICRYHDLIMRLGRSKGVGIVNCTQRPCGVHNNILSQSEHFFIFQLPLLSDRKKLAGFCGPAVLEAIPEYHFWYYNFRMDRPILCKPVKI